MKTVLPDLHLLRNSNAIAQWIGTRATAVGVANQINERLQGNDESF